MPLPASSATIACDMSTGTPRPFVPSPFRRTVFKALHSLSHPGEQATRQLIAARFVWSGMKKDIRAWSRTCLPCQRSKIQRHTVAPFSTFKTPDSRFVSTLSVPFHLHMDTSTCSRASTVSPAGLRPSRCQT